MVFFLLIGISYVFADDNEIRFGGSGGNYWIEDDTNGICVLIEVVPTEESGVYDFFCNGNSYRAIQSSIQFLGVALDYFYNPVPGSKIYSLIATAVNTIYDLACAYFE
jgi:hypothetical protein